MIDLTQLAAEIGQDPKGLGYAGLSNDEISRLFNDRENLRGQGPVKVEAIDSSTFMLGILGQALINPKLLGGDSTLVAKYTLIINVLSRLPAIPIGPITDALIQNLANDGLLDPSVKASYGMRMGSRAEVLFGVGMLVTEYDCRIARGE